MRWLSKTMFGLNTTVDGNRLDRAAGDIVSRFNALRAGDLEHRWFEQRYISGMVLSAAQTNAPWELTGASIYPVPSGTQNPYKWKGYGTPGASSLKSATNGGAAWSMAVASSKPSRLRRITVFIQVQGGAAPVDWVYGSVPPPGSSTGDPCNDWAVEVLVANPFAVESRSQASLAILRERFAADSVYPFPRASGLGPAASNTVPMPWVEEVSGGLVVDVECDVWLPPFARVMPAVILPLYEALIDAPWPQAEPWSVIEAMSWSMVTQERA